MNLQIILNRLQKLHPKEIDLSLDRIKNLCKKLGNPQENLKCISVVGTNGKYSTIQSIRAILKEANINVNIYSSPHIQKINERFIYNDKEISDEGLVKLLDPSRADSYVPWIELGLFLGFLGLFITSILKFASVYPMLSLADPILPSSYSEH